MKKVSYFLSHPIQYQTPLIQNLHKNLEGIELDVVYFANHTIGGYDKQFGINVKWDIPLLHGYNFHFLKNYSPRPSVSNSFFGLINFGVIKYLIIRKPDYIVVHGWAYFSNILLLLTARVLGIKILMRAESPLQPEMTKNKFNILIKKVILNICDRFLYIGKENKAFYKYFNIPDEYLFYTPYCVDNERFLTSKINYNISQDSVRPYFNIPMDNKVLLFCGKLIPKKRPFDVIKALDKLKRKDISLILVGTGELSSEIENYIKENGLDNIHLAGFINQSDLYKYYLSSDIFILPSTYGETWGLVVNEAMLHELPIIVSDHVGCVTDLVTEELNGYSYECGNIQQLSILIDHLCSLDKNLLKSMGKRSFEIVQNYSFNEVSKGFSKALS